MRTTIFSAIVSTLCGTMAAQCLTRSSDSRSGRVLPESLPVQAAVQSRVGASSATIERTLSPHGAILRERPLFRISVLHVDPSQQGHILHADIELTPIRPGYLLQSSRANMQVPGAWHIKTGSSSPISVADSADKDNMDKFGAQFTAPDPTLRLVNDGVLLTGNYA